MWYHSSRTAHNHITSILLLLVEAVCLVDHLCCWRYHTNITTIPYHHLLPYRHLLPHLKTPIMDSPAQKYDPNRIIQAANEKLQQDADWQGGDHLFQAALLEWSDDARESGDESLREALATLYMAYANFLAGAKQYKSSMDAYENATLDLNVASMGRIWLEYAAFCQDRQKFVKAQQVYLRALVGVQGGPPAVTDEQDREILWHSLWEMVKEQNNNPDMTLEELQAAVIPAPTADVQTSTPMQLAQQHHIAQDNHDHHDHHDHDGPAHKKMKFENPAEPHGNDLTRAHVVTPESVKDVETSFLQILQQPDLPPEIRGAWMMLDGTGVAQPPEPPLFQASPPKLSDPSGKDTLGIELSLALTKQLLEMGRGSLLLQVCRALWVMTAVNEQAASQRLDRLDLEMQEAVAKKESEFASQISVAQPMHKRSVEQVIQQQRLAMEQSCSMERQKVLQEMAWQARRLLCAQQVILQKLGVPTFEGGATVDAVTLGWQAKVCSYLHSAFYLRNRIGEETHVSMLKSQCKKLEKELDEMDQQNQSSAATHSLPPPPPAHPNYGGNVQLNQGAGGGSSYNMPPPGHYPGMMHQQPPPPGYNLPPPPHYPGMLHPQPPPPPPPPGSYPYYHP